MIILFIKCEIISNIIKPPPIFKLPWVGSGFSNVIGITCKFSVHSGCRSENVTFHPFIHSLVVGWFSSQATFQNLKIYANPVHDYLAQCKEKIVVSTNKHIPMQPTYYTHNSTDYLHNE